MGLAIKGPLLAGYAVYRAVAAVVSALAGLYRDRRLLGASLRCRWCGSRNSIAGRWKCGNCGGTFLGLVDHCEICGASCSFFECSRCRGSIVVKGHG